MEWIKFTFESFWHFVGMVIILTGAANFIIIIWSRFWRHWTIRKHGYPPVHCDADGDPNDVEYEETKE